MRVLITGATRGLGRATARAIAHRGNEVVVAGRDATRVARTAAEVGGTPLVLDLASPGSAARVAATLAPVDAVIANAGLQVTQGPTFTADGVEETLAVNVLGHVALLDALLASATPPAQVVLLGSGTHDPSRTTGMPAPDESLDLDALARGEASGGGRQRYATSKLHTTALAAAYARERPGIRWTCFDPGLMPGTGLARDHALWARALWSTAFRVLTVLPVASSPRRSGRALARVVLDGPPTPVPGGVVDHRLRPGPRSARAADPDYQDRLLAGTRRLVAGLGPGRDPGPDADGTSRRGPGERTLRADVDAPQTPVT